MKNKSLHSIQERMQRAILSEDDAVLEDICKNSKEQRTVLLNVYKHAYGARLTEFLENEFPILYTWLGEEQFGELATAYHKAHPSNHPNARWFGRYFAKFTVQYPALKSNPECGELCLLEHKLNQAFDAPDETPLTMADLAPIPPDQWADLTFKAHPSTSRLTFLTNAPAIWRTLHKEETPPAPEKFNKADELIVWRGEEMSRFRTMQGDEAMLFDEAKKGADFATLCKMLAVYWPEDEAPMKAAGYLQTWLNSEFFTKQN